MILAIVIAALMHMKVARVTVVIVCVLFGLVLGATPIGDGVNAGLACSARRPLTGSRTCDGRACRRAGTTAPLLLRPQVVRVSLWAVLGLWLARRLARLLLLIVRSPAAMAGSLSTVGVRGRLAAGASRPAARRARRPGWPGWWCGGCAGRPRSRLRSGAGFAAGGAASWVYRRRWAAAMDTAGLTKERHGTDYVPPLLAVRSQPVDGSGDGADAARPAGRGLRRRGRPARADVRRARLPGPLRPQAPASGRAVAPGPRPARTPSSTRSTPADGRLADGHPGRAGRGRHGVAAAAGRHPCADRRRDRRREGSGALGDHRRPGPVHPGRAGEDLGGRPERRHGTRPRPAAVRPVRLRQRQQPPAATKPRLAQLLEDAVAGDAANAQDRLLRRHPPPHPHHG